MKRLFIAIKVNLNEDCRHLLQSLQQMTRYDKIVWVNNDVSHLTLRFLGKTPDFQIPFIQESMKKAVTSFKPFSLQLDKLGFFGSHYAPTVIWLGFEEFETYRRLFLSLEQQLQLFGFEEQK
jgi:2'-5' RNA ligase